MNWIPPKTDWDSTQQGVSDADFNRIENNIKILGKGGVIQDVEGNVYRTTVINGQQWTADNWRCTKYNDGTDIPLITDQTAWNGMTTPAYCKYNNFITVYGLLYNWYVGDVANPKSILPPDGWRVPTIIDLNNLDMYLNNNGYAYDTIVDPTQPFKLATSFAATKGWRSTGATGLPGTDLARNNNSGVSVWPSGIRSTLFQSYNDDGFIWTSSVDAGVLLPYYLQIIYDNAGSNLLFNRPFHNGMAIKLVRDIVL